MIKYIIINQLDKSEHYSVQTEIISQTDLIHKFSLIFVEIGFDSIFIFEFLE